MYISIYLAFLSVCLFVCESVYLSVCLFVYLPVSLSMYQSISVFIYLSICLSEYLSHCHVCMHNIYILNMFYWEARIKET